MMLAIAAILAVLWVLGYIVFHVTTAAIHFVLIAAAIMVLLHFVRGTGRGVPRSTV